VEVLAVIAQVFSEVVNATRDESDLDFR